MPNTEPWWVCDSCNKPLCKVGSRAKGISQREMMFAHRKFCKPLAEFSIKQINRFKGQEFAQWK